METFLNVIASHGFYIVSTIFVLFLLLSIATLLFKNRKEYKVIESKKYHEDRKKTDFIITDKNNKQENEENKQKDGYQPKRYRGTDIEIAAWEDKSLIKTQEKTTQEFEKVLAEISTNNEIKEPVKTPEERNPTINEKLSGVKKSLMHEVINELRENRLQGVSSALESDSFTTKLIKKREKEAKSHSKNKGIAA